MYPSAWRSFEAWAQARGALSLPASPPIVAAYLAHLAEERRLSVATIRLHKAGLAAIHKAAGHSDPTGNEGVRQIMKGIARAHGRAPKQARPLTAEALAAVKATARSLAGKPLAGFCTTLSRRIPVLYGVVVYVIRFLNPLLHL